MSLQTTSNPNPSLKVQSLYTVLPIARTQVWLTRLTVNVMKIFHGLSLLNQPWLSEGWSSICWSFLFIIEAHGFLNFYDAQRHFLVMLVIYPHQTFFTFHLSNQCASWNWLSNVWIYSLYCIPRWYRAVNILQYMLIVLNNCCKTGLIYAIHVVMLVRPLYCNQWHFGTV